MLTPRYGDIVLVSAMIDPQGRNPKDRPAVVVTRDDEIHEDGTLEVAAITTWLPDPLPEDHVLLP